MVFHHRINESVAPGEQIPGGRRHRIAFDAHAGPIEFGQPVARRDIAADCGKPDPAKACFHVPPTANAFNKPGSKFHLGGVVILLRRP